MIDNYEFLCFLTDELNEFVDKVIAESNYTDYNGIPDSYLKLANIENTDSILLDLEYHRKYFEKKTEINGAIAGWNVKNDKDKFLNIPMEICSNRDYISMVGWYQNKTISCAGKIEDNEFIFEETISEIESKTVDNMLQKVINLIQIRANIALNDYLLYEEGEYTD